MTDEEFGRAWAAQVGIVPPRRLDWGNRESTWEWVSGLVPHVVMVTLSPGPLSCHDSEAEAYAALGAAVRAVHAAVPPLATTTDVN